MKFQDLRLSEPLLRAIGEKGYTDPTPIQQQAIPPVLEGRDLQGCAQTGTGKTAAFTLPMLQLLAAEPAPKGRRPIRALVLTPTRELAIQIDECCRDYARYTPIRHCVIFGGVNQRPQVDALQKGVDLLVATPGRLLDLIGQGYVTLDTIRFFVLDEADRMLDMGFIHDIRRILPLLPERRQTLFFSATMPESIAALAAKILRNPVLVTVTPPASVVETIAQTVHFAEKAEKSQLLIDLLSASDAQQVLVFSRTKHGADKLAKILNRAGIRSCAIHGNKSQNARVKAMNDFKSGECRVMIATDIAARGIDIDQLPLVINYELPEVAETYVHRIGRTGRAGHEGAAWSFCSEDEFEYLCDIQKLTGLTIPTEGPVPEYALRKAAPALVGGVLGLLGPSGSGKSTFLRLLMRFWDVNTGTIRFGEEDIRRVNTATLRAQESLVTQETELFNDTIENNIRIAKRDATREEVEAACKKAALDGFIRSLPKGYDTPVGELGGALSGGERQRIGVARAFLHDAPFLLLDEPTSNLDSLNEGVILKAVRAECRDKTVLLVSHRKSTMAAADVTYSVESGRLS